MTDDNFDLTRLTPCEREIWDRSFVDRMEISLALRLFEFGHICMLECEGPPRVTAEKLRELDPDNAIGTYLDNMRRARRGKGSDDRA